MPTPYAGNPSNFPASVDILSGSDVPGTGPFNTAYEGTLDRTAYLKLRTANAGQNWSPHFVATALAVISGENPLQFLAACWNPVTYLWAILASNDNANTDNKKVSAYQSYGLDGVAGIAANGIFGTASQPQAAGIAMDPNNTSGYIAAVSAATALKAYKEVAGTWTLVRTDAASIFLSSPVAVGHFGGYAFYATLTDAYVIKIASTNDSGATWSDHSGNVGSVVVGLAVAVSSSLAIVSTTYGAGSVVDYFTSPDGVAWTQHAFPFLGAHDEVTGVTWWDAAALFVAAVQTDVSTTRGTAFYSSPDGLAWTLIATGPTLDIGDLASCGPSLVCAGRDDGSSPYRSYQIFSDDGGASWYRGQPVMPSNVAPASDHVRPTLVAAQTQIFAFNTVYGRFSAVAGLPLGPL